MAVLIVAAIAVFFVRYLEFVGHTRNKEVASQLSEVYGQINNQFNDLAQNNWAMLKDSALALGISEDEKLKAGYIQQLRKQWKFDEWLFVNDNGGYIDMDGHTGNLNLGKDFYLFTEEDENIVVDGTLTGAEPMVLFVVPSETNVFQDFTYSAVAIAYRKEALKESLEENSYEGNAESYLLYPDGRILLSLQDENDGPQNLFTLLETVKFKGMDYEEVCWGIKNGMSGTYRYSMNGSNYYLYYQPVGFQDWVMAGIVPQNSVGKYVDKILRQTTLLSFFCFAVIFTVVAGILYHKNRQEIRIKDEELSYRERMFEILSNNNNNVFIVMIPDKMEVEYVSSNSERVIGVRDTEIKKNLLFLEQAEYPDRPDLAWKHLEEIPLGGYAQIESVRRHAKTGERLWFEEMVYHVKIGTIERFIFVLQDRTKERKAQANLETALDIAKTANESKSAFLSSMSHDIRTPMNVIIGFLPLLQRDAENADKVREYAKKN